MAEGRIIEGPAPRLFGLPPGTDFGREVVAGLEADALAGGGRTVTRRVLAATVPFVLGFTLVFALAGAAAGAFGGAADDWRPVLIKAGGVLIVAVLAMQWLSLRVRAGPQVP